MLCAGLRGGVRPSFRFGGGSARTDRRGGALERAYQGRTGLRLGGERAGDCGGGEARVGQSEPQRVQVAHEARVDEGDPAAGRDGGEECCGVTGVGGGEHVEAQGPQVVRERRAGYRRTGEDGGRQTNSLLGTDGVDDTRQRGHKAGRRHVG